MDQPRLEQRLSSIEARLKEIEKKLEITPPIPSPVLEQSVPLSVTKRTEVEVQATPSSQAGKWLGLISVICFVLAAGFIIKLSIDSGWLTPQRQVGLAYILGYVLIGLGYKLLQRDRVYASFLPAAGIIILYVTAFAEYQYYSLTTFEVAIGITALISLLCIWLYTIIKHDIYAIIAAIGAYVSPVILGFDVPTTFTLYYLILCSLTFATISIWVRSRMLTMISAYLAILMTASIGLNINQDKLIAIVLAAHFIIFSLGTYLYTKKTKYMLTENEAWSFFPVLLIFYAVEYYYIDRIDHSVAPWISLGFAGLLIGLYLGAKKWFSDQSLNSQPMIIAFATVVCFHSVYLELLPAYARPWLFVVITFGFCLLPNTLLADNKKTFNVPLFALFIILGIEYLDMMSHLIIAGYDTSWLMVALASFASLWAVLVCKGNFFITHEGNGYFVLGLAHLIGITAFYQLVHEHGSLAVSASWLLYAVIVIVLAFIRKDKIIAKSALFVLAFAAGKALLYDAASAPSTVRILCLLLTGVVLYFSGFFLRKISSWK